MDSVRKKHPCGLDAPPLTTKQDTERLPSGFERIGYDSDTQIYTFRDSEGNTYESEPGNRYGELRPVRSPSRHMMFAPAETTEGHNAQPSRSFADMLSGQEDAIEEQNKEATRIMLPFALLVLVFLVLVFKLLYRSDNGSVADPQDAIDCGEGSDGIQLQQGDTCWAIAQACSITVEELLGLRGNEYIDCARLVVGKGICVPT